MKNKIIVGIAVCMALMVIIAGTVMGIKHDQREQDLYWQLAKRLYNMESALQKIDANSKLTALSRVIPYCYQTLDGDTITYYCCITTYVDDAPSGYFGINQAVLEQVVDMDVLENCRVCKENGLDAVLGELDGRTWLCWTISPTYSCVLEYTAGSISKADIFRMAESVSLPPKETP